MAYIHSEGDGEKPDLTDHLALPQGIRDIDASLEDAEKRSIDPDLTEEERGQAKAEQLRLRAQRVSMISESALSEKGIEQIKTVDEPPLTPWNYDGPPVEHKSFKLTRRPKPEA